MDARGGSAILRVVGHVSGNVAGTLADARDRCQEPNIARRTRALRPGAHRGRRGYGVQASARSWNTAGLASHSAKPMLRSSVR